METLYTTWGETLDQEHVLPEYPRPLMVRDRYEILNGLWDYAFSPSDVLPTEWEGKILVPFSPESLLSGVGRQLQPGEFLWYQRSLPIPSDPFGHLLLHFGAVDQQCRIFINGDPVGSHMGGYLPFTLDITEAVRQVPHGEDPLLQVLVRDDSDTSYHARGKQKLQRGGMYYTAQSGIWQTVWTEWVPQHYIQELTVTPDPDQGTVTVCATAETSLPVQIIIGEPYTGTQADAAPEFIPLTTGTGLCNQDISISLTDLHLWNCETPYLYPIRVTLDPASDTPDDISSYFALRTFSIEKDEKGIPRICLNHEPQFQRGVLDQGYWSDGLYTAPSDEALIYDIVTMKQLGYNMIRKHAKIEPQRWYYHCDRLGMVVWQDMVNGGTSYADWYVTYLGNVFSALHIKPKDRYRKLLSRQQPESREEFAREMSETIHQLKSHPSIAVWVIFNEGWGQFDTKAMTEQAKREDPSRLIDSASGWFDQGCGDFNSIHNYFFPLKIKPESHRASVLSEFGGYSMPVSGHIACKELYGYGTYHNKEELQAAFSKREAKVKALIPQGLCASVYTQVSDVEDEVNGILTYDRREQKLFGSMPSKNRNDGLK